MASFYFRLVCSAKFRAIGNYSWPATLFSAFLLPLLVLHVSPVALHVFPEFIPQAFSIPLSQVIANDRTHRQRQDSYRQDHLHREEQKDSSDLVSSILQVCHIYGPSYIMVPCRQAAPPKLSLHLFCSLPQSGRPTRSYPAVTPLWVLHQRLPTSHPPIRPRLHPGHAGGCETLNSLWDTNCRVVVLEWDWLTISIKCRAACQWTPSQTWMTTSPACWRRCSSPCRLKRRVKKRSTGTKGWASIPSTVRCPGWSTAAVSTLKKMVILLFHHLNPALTLICTFKEPV